MSLEQPFNVYREQLSSLYRGLALWKPNPEGLYDQVALGDVGYVSGGAFIRMFNVTLPSDDESNRILGIPDGYELLNFGSIAIRRENFGKVEYYSRHVIREENINNALAASPDQTEGVTYRCKGRGALLSLPYGGHREEAIHTRVFEKYIGDHVVSWFKWSRDIGLPVERMEDLVLVYGCTLVTSWAAAAFDDYAADAQVSLARRMLNNGGASFVWSNYRGTVEYHDSQLELLDPNGLRARKSHCVFMKCFRAKRILFWTRPVQAAAEPLPDDPDNSQDDEIQVTQVPGGSSSEYRDPLIGVLDYIVEKRLEDEEDEDYKVEDHMAITHHDDLQLIKDVEVLTADAVEKFLHENEMSLFVTDGATVLQHPVWQFDEHEESDRSSTSSFATTTTLNAGVDAFEFLSHLRAQKQKLLGPPPPNRGDQSTVEPTIDASDNLSCPPVQKQMPLDVPLPRSDTKRLYREETGDVPNVIPGTHLPVSPVGHPSPISSATFPRNTVDILPPLPEIRSEQIRKRIFTHSLTKGKHAFQTPQGDPPVDNEELRQIGDQVFALAVTDLIQQCYPYLRVGPASKVRDRMKSKNMLATICMSYGLHMGLDLPERQASDLWALQSVQVDVFKAYVGGLYRDQGVEVVSEWLIPLLQPHVKNAYRSVREDHLLPPETEPPPQLETPTSYDPSPISYTMSEDTGPALPSYLAGGPRNYRRLTALPASVPQQSSEAGGGAGSCHAATSILQRRHRSRSPDASEEHRGSTVSVRSIASTVSSSSTLVADSDSARKRLKKEGTDVVDFNALVVEPAPHAPPHPGHPGDLSGTDL